MLFYLHNDVTIGINNTYNYFAKFNTLLTFYLHIIIKLKLVFKKIPVTHIHFMT